MSAREFRWKLADDNGGQGALFAEEELVDRHVGRGEYRGLEFLHVNAKRIINEVPKASRVPFRYTINAYRGCSHACSYCQTGDTPVLMADGRTRELAQLRVGDLIYGTRFDGRFHRYVRTRVLAHWSTVREAYRLRLEDGTELMSSSDHRFLTTRGWKHVTGSEQGRTRRPHLTLNNQLLGTGAFAVGPDHDADYRTGYLCGMIRGDANLGSYAYQRVGRTHGDVHRFRLALIDLEPLWRTREYLSDFAIQTSEFVFQKASGQHREIQAIRTQSLSNVTAIQELIRWPTAPTDHWAKGFLAGIFDAEGSCSCGILRICNTDEAVIGRIKDCLRKFGFRFTLETRPGTNRPVLVVRLLGGLQEQLRFFHMTDPAITRKRDIEGRAIKNKAKLRVAGIEPLGISLPMYDITTGTGDFIANGVVSHNCFARPTHDYLGLNIGDDFDSKIVVKVNAVERLRAELRSPRWGGDDIAMGTNTDPYQRCEGKYHLTQGIIKVLGEAGNPFSILTKSPLILRDLDLLEAAAERTSVQANFSIGTLDEGVWKSSEPGTAHPRRRVEAVAKLNEAGIPCGVLVAPVLPGISDAPEQLEAVVNACVQAGATHISAIGLHLRAGVRQHFFDWLTANRPELVGEYERRFQKAYQPAKDQDALAALVRTFVSQARGRWGSPRAARSVTPRQPAAVPAAPPEPAAQLGLSL